VGLEEGLVRIKPFFSLLHSLFKTMATDQTAVSSSALACRCTHPTADLSDVEARQTGTEERAAEAGLEVKGQISLSYLLTV